MRSTDEKHYEIAWGRVFCKYCRDSSNKDIRNIAHNDNCPMVDIIELEGRMTEWAYELQKVRLQRAVLKSVLRKLFALLEEHLPQWYLRGHYLMILNALGKKDGYHVEN